VALVGSHGERALGADPLDARQGAEEGDNPGVEWWGAGFPSEEGSGEVMGDGAGENDEIGAEAVQRIFEPLLDGLAKNQG